MFFTNETEFKSMIEGAVLSALQKVQAPQAPQTPARNEKKYIHSMHELAKLLNCSVVTAQKFKNAGLVPYKQMGRKLIFDVDQVLAAMPGKKWRA